MTAFIKKFFIKKELDKIKNLEFKIQKEKEFSERLINVSADLVTLNKGCSTHSSYKAIRKSKTNCQKCLGLYSLKQNLNSNPIFVTYFS